VRVHNIIPQLLIGRRWTMGKLAQRSGVDKGHLSRIISGRRMPGVLQAWRIAAAFGLGIEEVFRFDTKEVKNVRSTDAKNYFR
jgi:transcriptional regulator with XRE-family HTH domain